MEASPSAEELCETEAERASLARLRELASETDGPLERHGVRAFLLCLELAARGGLTVDRELLLCAALLHDVGLLPGAATGDLYIRDGRRVAEDLLFTLGWPTGRLTLLGETVERHHEVRSQWRRGAEVELLRRADLIEVSAGVVAFGLPRGRIRGLFRAVPREGFFRGIGVLVVRVLRDRPSTLPRIFAPSQR